MAITWELKIAPLDVRKKIAHLRATRTDSEDPDNPKVYEAARCLLDTQAHQVDALNEIWAKHQIQLSKDEVVQEFLDALEAQGKTNLEARE